MTVVSTLSAIIARRWLLSFIGLLLFIVVALTLHHGSFDAPMYYDSVTQLESKEHIFASGNIDKVIRIFPQRPVAMATFYFNYLIWGMNPFYFRIVNAVLLAFMAWIASGTAILILQTVSHEEPNQPVPVSGKGGLGKTQAVGLFLGLVFLVHPVQTYFVAYIWQRMALLSCLFYLISLLAYLATRTRRIPYPVLGYAICAVFFALALTSKENAITLPAVLLIAEVTFFGTSWQGVLKRAAVFSVIVAAVLLPLSFVETPHGAAGQTSGIITTLAKYYQESGLSLFQVLTSQCRVLFSYLALILVPIPANVRFISAHVIASSPFDSAATAVTVVGALALLVTGIWLLRRRPVAGFGLLFFLINLMPESLLVPQYSFFAYRAILPMFGMLLVLADGILLVLKQIESSPWRNASLRLTAAVAVAAILAMGAVTLARAKLWQDPALFWEDIVEGFPSDKTNVEKLVMTHALSNLGAALQKQNRNEEAVAAIHKAVTVDPRSYTSYWLLGVVCDKIGDPTQAESALLKAIEIEPRYVASQFALGDFYLAQDRLPEAWTHMRAAANLAPDDPRCINGLGMIVLRQGKPPEAASYFRKAIELTPGFDQAHFNLGEAFASMGMDADALLQYRKALNLKSDNWRAHNGMGLLLAKSDNSTEAIAHFRAALTLNPDYWSAHNNLGVLLAKSGNLQEAATHFEETVKLNPDAAGARKNLERVRHLLETSR